MNSNGVQVMATSPDLPQELIDAETGTKPQPLSGSGAIPWDLKTPFFNVDDELYLRDPWLFDGLLRAQEVMNLVSDSKAYKSFTLSDMAICGAYEIEFMGMFPCRPGIKTLIIDNELKANSFRSRAKLIAEHHGKDPKNLDQFISVVCLREHPGGIPDIHHLRYQIDQLELEFDLVVLDSLYRHWEEGKSENDNAAIAKAYNSMQEYTQTMNAAIVASVHSGKGSQAGKKNTDIGVGGVYGPSLRRSRNNHGTRERWLRRVSGQRPGRPVNIASQYPYDVPGLANVRYRTGDETGNKRR